MQRTLWMWAKVVAIDLRGAQGGGWRQILGSRRSSSV
jgi:hypothetical protein